MEENTPREIDVIRNIVKRIGFKVWADDIERRYFEYEPSTLGENHVVEYDEDGRITDMY